MKHFRTVTGGAESVCHVSETPQPGRSLWMYFASPDTRQGSWDASPHL